MAHVRTDYDAWVEDNIPNHVDSILASLGRFRRAAPPPRPTLLVDPRTGHLNRGPLCWVCFAADPLRDRRLPRFRACRNCMLVDRQSAASLGLVMLLPLMDYPSHPRLRDATPPDGDVGGALTDVWRDVAGLQRWRIEGVQLGCAFFDAPADIEHGVGIGFAEWQERLEPGQARSRACWNAYVAGYHPRVMAAVASMDVQEPARRRIRPLGDLPST